MKQSSHIVPCMNMNLCSDGKQLRTQFLGDVENLAGRPTGPTEADVIAIAAAVDRVFGHLDPQSVVACAHRNAPNVWFNWPSARHLVRSGPNGADLCLLEVIDRERVAERFDRVVIGSADGDFAEAAARLASQGVHVIAAIGRGRLASSLKLAVREVVRLPLDPVADSVSNIMEVRLSA